MMKWLIATYIVVILVFSAKAKAISLDSNPALIKFNHPANVTEELKVQDPLPDFNSNKVRQMNIDSVLENSVG